ncbi:hypothetical protein [Marinigracilibium pacificum]|uniref:Uncharacterized protein n=1 Tax=Marinigracilibium pacificum TaxID=2729599 RepID=A0A848IWH8_9BACT|nr:hypothetical protein [Marinigracilibium pacificum]NMM47621.1 hypothetical protein [Marinigracilibium pacificum]
MKYQKLFQITIIVILVFQLSCNSNKPDNNLSQKTKSEIENIENNIAKKYKNNLKLLGLNSNKLVFKRYYLDPDSNILRDPNSITWSDSTVSPIKIKHFNKLFEKSINKGYCCCPFSYYSITFYKDEYKLGMYFVDTLNLNGKAMVFDKNFQTSYFINKKEWELFLEGN